VPVPSVDELRRELRERGYLSHAIERWFAHDPFTVGRSSRAFWLELTTVAAKAALLIALFAIVPLVAVMLFRNHPLSASETLLLSLFYGVTGFVTSFLLLLVVALVLKLRPTIVIDTPRALLAISFAAAALLTAPIALWWYRFPTPPFWPELLTGIAATAAFFVVTTIAVSAALLSFSIYELQRVPAIHQKPRGVPMTIAATILIALLFLPTFAAQDSRASSPPLQVVTTPTNRTLTLIAVDGLTYELGRDRLSRLGIFSTIAPIAAMPGASATERWASAGTGVPASVHGVRAVDGVRFRDGRHLLQSVSPVDFVLRDLAELVRLASREPLPPTVRRRDYVWEIFAARSLPSVSVNWWTTDDVRSGALDEISQKVVFAAAGTVQYRDPLALNEDELHTAHALALRIDETASQHFVHAIEEKHPRFATVYLPALDIILNRLSPDKTPQIEASVFALEKLDRTIAAVRGNVIVIGLPGDGQRGHGIIASQFSMTSSPRSAFDLAPTLCSLLGFPASDEMPGRSMIGNDVRIPTYGPRITIAAPAKVNEEYYENLRSLGYIR
jgi:Type I phosphodiesterase / nucleotide pyrophosphatase.